MENQQTLNKALQLYDILGKYIPAEYSDDYFDYANKILDNIQKGNPEDYFTSIQLMTDVSRNVLEVSQPVEVLELFMRALVEWRIIELVEFFRDIGYTND